ncbi:oxidized low-density lipoprotein receptor 1 [Kryptolebias marmoratus]|uniref:oxidized low-density lipoprotein receptor 1 n=1 Tax=Kryptolebias marmoratus TaxID=37003 RepID=UPI0007F89482|nr:oxidized low-density lipoprotein receptor 1 [Kryptolebias marmoratus]
MRRVQTYEVINGNRNLQMSSSSRLSAALRSDLMEPQEQIYTNLQELNVPDLRRPEGKGGGPAKPESVAERKTEYCRSLRVLTACLGLLSVILLVSVVAVAVNRDRGLDQLIRDLANRTAEWKQLLARHQNLTDERNQLNISLETAEVKLDRLRKTSVTCPDGWRIFGCSCYLLSSSRSTWDSSRTRCFGERADLVTISSREEMMFLNKLGTQLKFWIGLKNNNAGNSWAWTDGRPPGTTFWQIGHP